MYSLINTIHGHKKTPAHLRQYLFDHVDTGTEEGLALFDVLSFTKELASSWPMAHELFGEDGQPFRQLANIVIQELQATPDYQSLKELVRQMSQKLESHKDENGFVSLEGLTVDEASHWVKLFHQSKSRPSLKELRA